MPGEQIDFNDVDDAIRRRVDATIIAAPSRATNAAGARDPRCARR